MMSLWDALRMNMMISYQELVRTFPNIKAKIMDWRRYWDLHEYVLKLVIRYLLLYLFYMN
ncbi:Uncharacterised protein [Klebsiella pneumoniae]|nr:Uncharacterised protein [Klebsiella pneumoniae]